MAESDPFGPRLFDPRLFDPSQEGLDRLFHGAHGSAARRLSRPNLALPHSRSLALAERFKDSPPG